MAEWGVVEIIGDYRAAKIVETFATATTSGPDFLPTGTARVELHKVRHAFGAECLDCGESPHVSPDEGSIAICLRCGRDRWL